jgi:hypothetical protein
MRSANVMQGHAKSLFARLAWRLRAKLSLAADRPLFAGQQIAPENRFVVAPVHDRLVAAAHTIRVACKAEDK